MRNLVSLLCLLLLGSCCFASECNDHSDRALYESHQLFELREAVNKGGASVFYQGIVACAFNDLRQCKKKLQSVIKSAPNSTDARQARTTLAAVAFRSGRFRDALSQVDAMLKVNPEDAVKDARPLVAALARLPNQSVIKRKASKVPLHAWSEDLAIPFTINGRPATYAFDTGNFAVTVTVSEAKRLGLKVYETDANVKVNGISVQVAIADQFAVGNFRFKSVAFIVFPDDQEPFSDMPEGERGIVGLPTLLAFRNFSWGSDRTFEFGSRNQRSVSEPNVAFNEQFVMAQVEFRTTKLTFGLDTGSEASSLGPRFAETFADLVKQYGKKDSKKSDEIGSNRKIDSVSLAEVELSIAGFPIVLRPAHILFDRSAVGCSYGKLGMDLMKQSQRTTIDFESMTLAMR
jgi:predicted aspartyl protease